MEVVTPDPLFNQYALNLLKILSYNFPLGYSPKLEWRNLRTSAGMASDQEGMILLSIPILDSMDKLEDTVRHEFAHLLAVARHGKRARGHGPEWRKAMFDLGRTPDVHHQYDCQRNRSHQVVRYQCQRCGEIIEKKRRFPRGRQYQHIHCGGLIRFHSTLSVMEVVPGS